MGGFLAQAFTEMPPEHAHVQMAALFANMVGNIPKEQWEKMRVSSQKPCDCGDPHCGEAIKAIMLAGDAAREQFERVVAKRESNPDEKGFSE